MTLEERACADEDYSSRRPGEAVGSIPPCPSYLPSPMRPSGSVADRAVARLQVVKDGLDMPRTI